MNKHPEPLFQKRNSPPRDDKFCEYLHYTPKNISIWLRSRGERNTDFVRFVQILPIFAVKRPDYNHGLCCTSSCHIYRIWQKQDTRVKIKERILINFDPHKSLKADIRKNAWWNCLGKGGCSGFDPPLHWFTAFAYPSCNLCHWELRIS